MVEPSSKNIDSSDLNDHRFDFPVEEEKILKYWDSINAFYLSNELAKDRPLWTFYDGPPFATGLPHYGHILAGTIKDTVCRYAYQKGHNVPRRFGWDCHGLPVEHEIDKKLNISCRADIEKLGGIADYNKACREIVSRYSSEWEITVQRTGRWIDFKDDYKTMYPWFMESVWWVFKSLWDKSLVYQGHKVLPYSTACTSPISNFEANLNYKEIVDTTIYVSVPLIDKPDTNLLIWTTTPWTLPANLAITAHPELVYVEVLDSESQMKFIVAEALVSTIFKDPIILSSFKGSEMLGWHYEPLFPFFQDRRKSHGNFVVINDSYVTADTGTGLVHCSPAHGEDDHRVALLYGIILENEPVPATLDERGHFLPEFFSDHPVIPGSYFKDADKEIIKILKENRRLFKTIPLKHSYPFCWRSDTPLIYRAVPSWFIRVTDAIPQLLENQAKTRWVPSTVGEKKFTHWLASAHDWAVSRNRYWGTPIPVWSSPDNSEIVVVGSIEELARLSNRDPSTITDLHREFVDQIEIPSQIDPVNRPVLRRIDEVFDCWFESGSVPYASQHFPFSESGPNPVHPSGTFAKAFPADFIAEGVDQTRGWFYTLSVLSTLLMNAPPFRNVIVNGLILAADGKKMSKRLKNYPEPERIMNQYGADALRLYLINSPVVCAEFLRFKEEGVRAILRDVLIPWVNTVRFFTEQAALGDLRFSTPPLFFGNLSIAHELLISDDTMDRWILSLLQTLIKNVRQEMDEYRLYSVVPLLLQFISALSQWYLRLSRKRAKNVDSLEDRYKALGTLYYVLYSLAVIMAPFTPFLAESLYQELRAFGKDKNGQIMADSNESSACISKQMALSVHFLPFPQVVPAFLDTEIELSFSLFQEAVDQARAIREQQGISLKHPLSSMLVIVDSVEKKVLLQQLAEYMEEDLNVHRVSIATEKETEEVDGTVTLSYHASPNFSVLGKRLRHELGLLQKALKEQISDADLRKYFRSPSKGLLVADRWLLTPEEIAIVRTISAVPEGWTYLAHLPPSARVITLLDVRMTDSLLSEGHARELIAHIQKLRKRAGLKASEAALVSLQDNPVLSSVVNNNATYLDHALRNTKLNFDSNAASAGEEILICNQMVKLSLNRAAPE